MTTIQIVRKLLSSNEVGGDNNRYNDSTDIVQTTPDGGITWNDNPGADPRHNTALQNPPRGGSDPQCDAAANMRANLEKFINTIVTVATQGAGASAILGVLAVFMPEIAILWLLCTEVMGGLLSIGQSVINAAFTTPVYDALEQIFYCNIASDGTCTAEQLSQIEDAIASQIGGVVQTVMALYLSLTGEVGLTNSGATGDAVGDCSGFGCGWCYNYLWQTGVPDSWNVVSGQGGSFFFSSPYWVWDGTLVGSVPSSLGIEALLGDGTINYHVTDWSIEWAMADAFGTFNDFVRLYDKDNNLVYTFSPGIADGGSQAQITSSFSGLSLEVARILIRGDARNYVVALNFNLTGDTVSPFGSSNC